jgi:hypothetical protein
VLFDTIFFTFFMPEQNKCVILCPKIHCWGPLITFSLVNGALSVTFLIKYCNQLSFFPFLAIDH